MKFTKAHAYGNDFLYVAHADVRTIALDALARELCDRHAGAGADGLIVYDPGAGDVSMQLFNADGSPSEVSGNGVRGLAALLLRHEPKAHARVTITTTAGPKRLERLEVAGSRQTFRAAMGAPRDIRRQTVEAAGESIDIVALDMGNPQCLVLGPLPDDDRFHRLGPALAGHAAFSAGTNVEFVRVDAPDRLSIRIWERGVGPTRSSGTGACGSLVAAASFGGASRDATVVAPGGEQRVEWRDDGVYLTGWAEILFDGRWVRD